MGGQQDEELVAQLRRALAIDERAPRGAGKALAAFEEVSPETVEKIKRL